MVTIPDPCVWAGDNAKPKALGSDNHVRPKRLGIAIIPNPSTWALQGDVKSQMHDLMIRLI